MLSQSIKFEIAKRKAYTKLKLRESEDRVKRGQCALTPLTSVKGRFKPHFDGVYLY